MRGAKEKNQEDRSTSKVSKSWDIHAKEERNIRHVTSLAKEVNWGGGGRNPQR